MPLYDGKQWERMREKAKDGGREVYHRSEYAGPSDTKFEFGNKYLYSGVTHENGYIDI